jgi:hypothetical protein
VARVLLVHDDLAEAARLRRVLRAAGFAPDVVASAADAAPLAAGCDAVVVDVDCDAGEALAWARRLAGDAGAPPVIVLAAAPADAAPLPSLARPADAPALVAALGEAVARARAAPSPPPPPAAQPATVPPPPAPPPPAPPGPVAGPVAASPRPALARTAEAALRALFGARAPRVSPAEARGRLQALAEAARGRDYFELLGLPRDCTGEEARLAADALLAGLERDLKLEDDDAEAGAWLAEVRQVALDARDVLGDDALREAYRKALSGG